MKTVTNSLLFSILFVCSIASAQQVPRAVLAEHFTNTFCSVCAARNPGLLANLANYPQVLHLSYYPSAPYPACPLNAYNKPENDARTHFYGVYGGTPQLLMNGTHITTPYTDPALFTSRFGQTTSFDLRVSITPAADSMLVKVVVKKVDTSSLTALQLYGAVAEDTLAFTAGNGETMHTDVFRKSLWGTTSLSITAPAAVGDSPVYTKMVAIDPLWARSRVYAIAILQRPDKQVEQAARSAKALTSSVPVVAACPSHSVCIYPNPASDRLYVGGEYGTATARIFDERGALKKMVHIDKQVQFIDISSLRAGLYFFVLNDGAHVVRERFVKQ